VNPLAIKAFGKKERELFAPAAGRLKTNVSVID
jgi:hypothetical protein